MPKEPSKTSSTSRRDVLAGAAVAGLMLPLAGTAHAAMKDHKHHHEAKHAELVDLALVCVGSGEICAKHCIDVMATGDTSLTDCLISVNEMLPMCNALARFAALDAKRLTQLGKVCIDVCKDCADECDKHADKHAECKACGEACLDLVKALERLTAA